MELFNDQNKEPITSYKELLVGEGKKFKDDESLAKGKYESDEFIDKLTQENKQLRQELERISTLEEMVDKLSKKTSADVDVEEPNPESPPVREKNIDIKSEVAKLIQEQKQLDNAERNVAYVKNELEKVWGDTISTKLKQKVKELGVSESFLSGLAATQPKAFLKLVVDTPVKTDPDIPQSNYSSSFSGDTTKKNHKYYEKLRRENRTLYFSPKVQVEMHKQAQLLGEDFYK